jgi:hypothetical protein
MSDGCVEDWAERATALSAGPMEGPLGSSTASVADGLAAMTLAERAHVWAMRSVARSFLYGAALTGVGFGGLMWASGGAMVATSVAGVFFGLMMGALTTTMELIGIRHTRGSLSTKEHRAVLAAVRGGTAPPLAHLAPAVVQHARATRDRVAFCAMQKAPRKGAVLIALVAPLFIAVQFALAGNVFAAACWTGVGLFLLRRTAGTRQRWQGISDRAERAERLAAPFLG